MTPFRIDPAWYEAYWLRERPEARGGARWANVVADIRRLLEALAAHPARRHRASRRATERPRRHGFARRLA